MMLNFSIQDFTLFVDLVSGLSSNGECRKKWKRFHRFHPTFPSTLIGSYNVSLIYLVAGLSRHNFSEYYWSALHRFRSVNFELGPVKPVSSWALLSGPSRRQLESAQAAAAELTVSFQLLGAARNARIWNLFLVEHFTTTTALTVLFLCPAFQELSLSCHFRITATPKLN